MSQLASPARTMEMAGGLSISTIRRLIEAGEFPKPVVLSRDRHGKPVRIAWVVSEIEAWCDKKISTGRDVKAEGRGETSPTS